MKKEKLQKLVDQLFWFGVFFVTNKKRPNKIWNVWIILLLCFETISLKMCGTYSKKKEISETTCVDNMFQYFQNTDITWKMTHK